MPSYGRIQAPEPPHNLKLLHTYDGTTQLKVSDHEPKVDVLDQEDLIAQGIDTADLVPGAQKVDALGSCTANTFIEAASNLLDQPTFAKLVYGAGNFENTAGVYADTVGCEKAAILFYHQCTDQTGDPSTEWPPTDCGSSGNYVVEEGVKIGACKTQRIAHGPQDVCSLLQSDGVMIGTPFYYSWEQPDAQGFIDNKGTAADLHAAIKSGLAGGHEIYLSAIEKIALTATGEVIPSQTVIRFRNHWTPQWGDHGSGRVHLSTLVMLGGQIDYRQIA